MSVCRGGRGGGALVLQFEADFTLPALNWSCTIPNSNLNFVEMKQMKTNEILLLLVCSLFNS